MNEFIGEGNLGQNPELKTVQGGGEDKTVANLRVYFDRRVPDGDGGFEDKHGFWLNVELWGDRASHVTRLCAKGTRVAVLGSLIDDSFERHGETLHRVSVRARQVYLVPTAKLEGLKYRGEVAA